MVQQASKPAPAQKKEKAMCRHHWIIDAPVGPVSRGVCQQCSEVREFKNYIESAPWGEDTSGTQSGPRIAVDTSAGETDEAEDL